MLQQLKSRYNAYILDTYSGDSAITYKIALFDKVFSEHEDYIVMCRKEDVLQLYPDPRFDFHNVAIDSDNSLWLTHCQPPVPYKYESREFVSLKSQQAYRTLWDFLWDAIVSEVDIIFDGTPVSMCNITFSMMSDDIILTRKDGETKLLWSPNSQQHKDITIAFNDSFYHKWLAVFTEKPRRMSDGRLQCKVNLDNLPCTYEGVYSSIRFCDEDLAYLAERYLLLKSHLHGVELGNWFMRKLNGIDTDLFGFKKPHIARSPSRIKFSFDAQLPNAKKISQFLENRLNEVYTGYLKTDSLSESVLYIATLLNLPASCYCEEFCKGFCSQISRIQSVIKDHEYLNAELMQTEITSIACQIFAYRLVMQRRMHDSQEAIIYLTEGTLKVEVIP